MSKSCDKDGSCEPAENAWAYLPDVEVKTRPFARSLAPFSLTRAQYVLDSWCVYSVCTDVI